MIDEAKTALLNDEMNALCELFRPDGLGVVFVGVLVDDEGDIRTFLRHTAPLDERSLINFTIGVTSGLQSLMLVETET